MNVSYWTDIFDTKERPGRETLSIGTFMNGVQKGRWKPETERIRSETSKEQRKALKNSLPQITPSGVFLDRKETGLVQHSGFLLLDFDHVPDVGKKREEIVADKYVAGTFISAGGQGLGAWIRIDPNKHEAAFLSLEKYFWEKYGVVADVGRKHIAATRAVSYDPDSTYNSMAVIWDKYLPARKPSKRYIPIPCTNSDIGRIVAQINHDIAPDFHAWTRIGLSLASLGESGREFFHAVSRFNPKYDRQQCDKKFDNLLDTGKGDVSIGTFYHMAEQAGLRVNREKPRTITRVCKEAKRQRKEAVDAIERLVRVNAIVADDAEDIALVKEVYEETESGISDGIAEVKERVQELYPTRYNRLSGALEHAESKQPVTDRDMADVYITIKEEIPTVRKADVIDIMETKCEAYHPIFAFIEKHRDIETGLPVGALVELLSKTLIPVIDSDSYEKDYIETYLTKWMVGMIAGLHGQPNPLMLALLGRGNLGKTWWLRHLLPDELQRFRAEPQLNGDKDCDLALCTNLLIIDEELCGKGKIAIQRLNDILTKDKFNLRKAYGRNAESYTRIATLAGTGNDIDILPDFNGNRRIIPIHVERIDQITFNAIDKTTLFMDAVRMYESGIRWQLTREDIARLEKNTGKHAIPDVTSEIILRHYRIPKHIQEAGTLWLSIADIMGEVGDSDKSAKGKWWTPTTIGRALRRKGVSHKRLASGVRYCLSRRTRLERDEIQINGGGEDEQ